MAFRYDLEHLYHVDGPDPPYRGSNFVHNHFGIQPRQTIWPPYSDTSHSDNTKLEKQINDLRLLVAKQNQRIDELEKDLAATQGTVDMLKGLSELQADIEAFKS